MNAGFFPFMTLNEIGLKDILEPDLLTARILFSNCLSNGQTIQIFPRKLNTLHGNAVVHPLALFAAQNDAGIAEDLHVVGQGGLADAQFLQKPTGAFFAAPKQLQNLQPVFIAECLENQRRLSRVHGTPPIEVHQYYMRYIHICQYVKR